MANTTPILLKQTPAWIVANTRRKRGILEDIGAFFTLTLSNEIPLITFASLDSCTQSCNSNVSLSSGVKRPLEASITSKLGDLKTIFTGLKLDNQFTIPFKLNIPKFAVCLPFLDVCSS